MPGHSWVLVERSVSFYRYIIIEQPVDVESKRCLLESADNKSGSLPDWSKLSRVASIAVSTWIKASSHRGFSDFLLSTPPIISYPGRRIWYSFPDCEVFDISFDKSDSCFFLIIAFVGNPKPGRPQPVMVVCSPVRNNFFPSLTCYPSGPSLEGSNVCTCAERGLSLIDLSALVMWGRWDPASPINLWKFGSQPGRRVGGHFVSFGGIRDASPRTFVGRPEVKLGVHDPSLGGLAKLQCVIPLATGHAIRFKKRRNKMELQPLRYTRLTFGPGIHVWPSGRGKTSWSSLAVTLFGLRAPFCGQRDIFCGPWDFQ
ncbi:hypothetical protein PCH_Pc12g11660 [Penicillium rubens Wisconsin 54-1255]|uniref:Uncharacterized protein n=1 Tax=Penicillium rubens (strain ATCC 28089 / DSM 1075 / NRRL 1951 / Wisconsin 54-1255) TaxID=500485 RepID=B6GXP5_PENRW|nr:hypothetical protein PCH_Pc12g11660 [Penicillium rubens Wisconsin 54-1255]